MELIKEFIANMMISVHCQPYGDILDYLDKFIEEIDKGFYDNRNEMLILNILYVKIRSDFEITKDDKGSTIIFMLDSIADFQDKYMNFEIS